MTGIMSDRKSDTFRELTQQANSSKCKRPVQHINWYPCTISTPKHIVREIDSDRREKRTKETT